MKGRNAGNIVIRTDLAPISVALALVASWVQLKLQRLILYRILYKVVYRILYGGPPMAVTVRLESSLTEGDKYINVLVQESETHLKYQGLEKSVMQRVELVLVVVVLSSKSGEGSLGRLLEDASQLVVQMAFVACPSQLGEEESPSYKMRRRPRRFLKYQGILKTAATPRWDTMWMMQDARSHLMACTS